MKGRILPSAFRGHGTFLYTLETAVDTVYGSPRALADALVAMHMSHAWVRIHGKTKPYDSGGYNQEVIAALRERGIAVAGWGWAQGDDVEREAHLAAETMQRWGLTHYVANIESQSSARNKHGRKQSFWTIDEVNRYFPLLRSLLSDDAFIAYSTFGFVDWHRPELAVAIDKHVDLHAPQVYWFNHPKKNMRRYGADTFGNSAAYAHLCLKRWRHWVAKPILMTGQAYWGEGSFTREDSEAKLAEFLRDFSAWDQIVGLNWWYVRSPRGGMSEAQEAMLQRAQIPSRLSGEPVAVEGVASSGSPTLYPIDTHKAWAFNERVVQDIFERAAIIRLVGSDPWGERGEILQAIARWQAAHGLNIDGLIGSKETLPAMRAALGL